MPVFKNQLLTFLKLLNHICLLSNLFCKNWHYFSWRWYTCTETCRRYAFIICI